MKKIEITINIKKRGYKGLDKEFTQVANSMIKYIKNGNHFQVYVYLCSLYNKKYDYAFPSLTTIAEDCGMSLNTVKSAIKGLCEKGYIKKGKYENNGGHHSNIYYIFYIIEEKTEKEIEIEDDDNKSIVIEQPQEEDEIIDTIVEYKDIK